MRNPILLRYSTFSQVSAYHVTLSSGTLPLKNTKTVSILVTRLKRSPCMKVFCIFTIIKFTTEVSWMGTSMGWESKSIWMKMSSAKDSLMKVIKRENFISINRRKSISGIWKMDSIKVKGDSQHKTTYMRDCSIRVKKMVMGRNTIPKRALELAEFS